MKAAVIKSPGNLTVVDVPIPEIGDYDALCRVLYGAVCSGTDRHLVNGDKPFIDWIRLPAVLGHESIGRVLETGSKVRNLAPGDLVTRVGVPATESLDSAWGGIAEFAVAKDWRAMKEDGIPEEKWRSYKINQTLPPSMDPFDATMVITWRETLSYIKRMGTMQGKSLLVIGSGGNGISFALHARNLGASTCAMIGSSSRASIASMVNLSLFVDYKADNAANHCRSLCPNGYDFVIDAVGNSFNADLGISLLKPGGSIGIYGLDCEIRINPDRAAGSFTLNKNGYEEAEAHEDVISLMESGLLAPSVFISRDHVYPIEDIALAINDISDKNIIKPVVSPT